MRSGLLLLVTALIAAGCGDAGDAPDRSAPGVVTTTSLPAATAAPETVPATGAPTTLATTTTTAPGGGSTVPPATVPPTTLAPVPVLALEEVAAGFGSPVFVAAPAGDERVFVVDQPGRIWIVAGGEPRSVPFLDIASRVGFGGERGLLGLAFHPEYADNGRLFVHYTTRRGAGRIAEYQVSSDPDVADAGSERVILEVAQPAANHNGGMIAFGPDGHLYVGLGDGGGADDEFGNGQRPDTLLGTLLRLDVDGAAPYAIPAGNPFASGGGAPEVWAYGLRNPWRFSFDGDLLYIGDVGQREWEEVDVAPAAAAGLNYGWPVMEALHCFQPPNGCDRQGLVLPAVEYGHGPECSVTGGYVYRGAALPALTGHYFYGDFCSGRIWSFRWDGTAAVDPRDWSEQLGRVTSLTSFGVDGFGELYVTAGNGTVYRLGAHSP